MSRDIDRFSGEEKLLSALINDPYKIFDIDNSVMKRDYFSQEYHRCIYDSIKLIAETSSELETIDPVLLELKISNEYTVYYEKNQELFSELLDRVYGHTADLDNSSLKELIRIVAAKWIKKNICKTVDKIKYEINNLSNPIEMIGHAETEILNFTNNAFVSSDITFVGESFEEWLEDGLRRIESGEEIEPGISVGFPLWEKALNGGLRPGSVNFIAARAKSGKSLVALWMSDEIIAQGIPVLYLDTELTEKKQMMRRCAQRTNITIADVERFKWASDEEKIGRIKEWKNYQIKHKLHYVSIKGWSLEKQLSIIRRFYSQIVGKNSIGKYKKGVVILDYLKLMNPKDKGADKEYETLGYHMTAMHNLMTECDNPMIAFGQQNRDGLHGNNELTLAGSDRISWFCDNLTLFGIKNEADMSASRIEQEGKAQPDKQVANCKFKVVLARDGSGNNDREVIGIYADIHDSSIGQSNACGIFKEKSIEISIV